MNKQKVVRTYDEILKGSKEISIGIRDNILAFPDGNTTATQELESALNDGYQVVMCHQIGMALEYILKKPEVANNE